MASERDFLIVEDDYEWETNYIAEPTPALKSMDADGRVVRVGSDFEPGGDHDPVILDLGVDVLHAVDAAHDSFQRLGRELRGVRGAQPGRGDHDVDHGHADLRLLLAGDRHQRHQADGDRRQQHQGSQR